MNQRKAGVILSYLHTGLNAVIMLVYVPMLLHYLTKEQYGVYQLMGSLMSVLALMDFGLSNGVTRFLAQAQARQNSQAQGEILASARRLYGLIAAGILGIGGLLYLCITPMYGETLSAQELVWAKQIFIVLLINMTACVGGSLFVAVLFARERFVFWLLVGLVGVVSSPLLIWGVLCWKQNVLYVALAQTCVNIGIVGVNYIYCRVKLGVRFGKYPASWSRVKQLTRFSWAVFVGNIAGTVYWRLGAFVLGAVAGAVAVANYYIASQICLFFIILSTNVGNIFLPKLSADAATSSSLASHNDIFCKAGRLQGLVAFLIWIGFALLGRVFLQLWLGPGNEVCYGPALILMTGYLLSIMQSVAGTALLSIDRYAGFAYISLGAAVLNILLAVPLSMYYGVSGSAVAAAFCLLVLQGVAANLYFNRVGLQVRRFIRAVAPVAGLAAGVWLLLDGLWHYWPVRATWMSFVAHGVVIVGVYASLAGWLVLDRFEWDVLNECWQFIASFGRKGLRE